MAGLEKVRGEKVEARERNKTSRHFMKGDRRLSAVTKRASQGGEVSGLDMVEIL